MADLTARPGIRVFFKVIWQDWGSRVSGIASVPFTFLGLMVDPKYGKVLWLGLAVLCVFLTAYQVWAGERNEVIKLYGMPEVTFTVLRLGGELDPQYLFRFLNASEFTAINVSLAPIKGMDLTIEFVPIDALVKSSAASTMEYKARFGGASVSPMPGDKDIVGLIAIDHFHGETPETFKTKLEFSNYGDVSRWQVDYTLGFDHVSKDISCKGGECRKLR